MNSIDIKNFYNSNQFPGHYTAQGLLYHNEQIKNPYLKIINQYLQSNNQVLDVGCGTGLISNLFAAKYPTAQFTSVDFSDGIDYAKDYANTNNIKNVKYLKKDFLEFKVSTYYLSTKICC
jgi:ubiquinone/menaquinone biosynthesis C-methylase UbiE